MVEYQIEPPPRRVNDLSIEHGGYSALGWLMGTSTGNPCGISCSFAIQPLGIQHPRMTMTAQLMVIDHWW